jgi:WhiB family redox-sensing transcriptional regulator
MSGNSNGVTAKRRRAPRTIGFMPVREGGLPDLDWMEMGACRTRSDVDFFPSDGAGVAIARRVCTICPVRQRCLEYALAEGVTHGVWGGASDRERQRMRAARARAG